MTLTDKQLSFDLNDSPVLIFALLAGVCINGIHGQASIPHGSLQNFSLQVH
jgi:hypothetical protein